jgi:hypothetical protein
MAGDARGDAGGGVVTRALSWLRSDMALFAQRFDVARRWFRARYMYVDPRTLGVLRIVIGFFLAADCVRHWVEARRYYSNEGVLSNHWQLFRPVSDYNFSLFHAFSSPTEVHVAFALSFVCYLLMMVGFKSRLMTILSLVWVSSMDNRLVLVENGGYIVVNLITFWLCWLPSGQRFSVDSWRRSWRARREGSVADLNAPDKSAWLTEPRHSLAAFILLVNFGTIYIFNVVNKYGSTWRAGDTLHYVLHLDRMVTGIAVWARELLPDPVLWTMTHMVLVAEATIVMTILWPTNRRWSRPLAMLLVFGLHFALGVMMRLGPFSWFMIGWSLALLMPVHWEMLEAWYRRRVGGVTLRFDVNSGFGWWLSRVVKRLDRAELVAYEAGVSGGALEVVERDGVTHRGVRAWWRLLSVLPAGRYVAPLVRVLSLGMCDALFWWIDRNAERLSRWFGLVPPQRTLAVTDAMAPARVRAARWSRRLRETCLVWLLLCSASQVINENKSVPEPIKHKQPKAVLLTMQYARIFQGWGMFAPNPIRDDGTVAVDAITIDGRHIDPFTGTTPDLDLSDARGLGLNQIHQDYFNRIRLDRNKRYRPPMERWIQRYHLETGNPNDEIVFYDVYWLTDRNPAPGSLTPTDHEKICIASWRNTRHRPPAGQPPLPRPCKVMSAGN